MTDLKIGDIIPFGEYNWRVSKSRRGSPPERTIGENKWRVLDIQEGKALIIMEDVIEKRAYNHEQKEVTWETCTLREYLNGKFLAKFDKSRIVPTTNQNLDNPWYGTSGGNPTQDYIFLLSLDEVCSLPYFGDSSANLAQKGTGVIVKRNKPVGVKDSNNKKRKAKYRDDAWTWWLRSPGDIGSNATYIVEGTVIVCGMHVVAEYIGVRPALWLKLNSNVE